MGKAPDTKPRSRRKNTPAELAAKATERERIAEQKAAAEKREKEEASQKRKESFLARFNPRRNVAVATGTDARRIALSLGNS